jgi:hypothetical protein
MASFTQTRKSLATRINEALQVAGVTFETVMVNGMLRYRINGEDLTPGQAAERYNA